MVNEVKNSVRPQNKHLKPHKKGENGGAHRPLGQKNYATLRAEAIIQLGKEKGLSDHDVDVLLVKEGLKRNLAGDFRYYKDDLDRTHGQATEKKDISLSGDLTINIINYGQEKSN